MVPLMRQSTKVVLIMLGCTIVAYLIFALWFRLNFKF